MVEDKKGRKECEWWGNDWEKGEAYAVINDILTACIIVDIDRDAP